MRKENTLGTVKKVHTISDITRVDMARKRVQNRAMGEKTIKIIASGLMALAILFSIPVNNASAKYILKEPPRYEANLLTDFMITKIVPSTGVVEATEQLLPEHDYHNIYHINLAFGSDPSDYELSQLRYDAKPGDTTIFNNNAIYGGIWIDGQSEDISKDFRRRGGEISGNTAGRMYFVAVYSDFKTDFGRIDYTRCINSSVFISGEATECRAESIGGGKIQYQPYKADGTRVEIPEEEDMELTALSNRFIYESGDWPAEYEWMDDEPENNDEGGNNSGTDNEASDAETTTDTAADATEIETDTDITRVVSETDSADTTEIVDSKDTEVRVSEVTSEAQLESLVAVSGASEEKSTGVLGTEPITVEIEIVDGGENTDGTNDDNKDTTDTTEEGSIAESGQDNVGVPELGKEQNNQKWLGLPLMLAGAAAAIVAWWFLFFGKKKSKKERKEEK